MAPSSRQCGTGGAAPAALGVTVIPGVCAAICTRNRTNQLRRALRSLRAQTREPAEILVVDNAPGSAASMNLVRDEFPGVRYVMEPVPGLDFARNRALRETSREIVAFMDDDVVAEPGMAGAILDVFRERGRIAVCTGKVEALSLETEGQRLFEANGGFARGEERIRLPADRKRRLHGMPVPLIGWSTAVGVGCCLAVRRRTILELGGFDEALDLGHPLPGGGDMDILWRVLDAGYEIVYDPAVQARHEHRMEVEASVNQIIDHHRALIAMLAKAAVSPCRTGRIGVLAFLAWRLAKPGVRLLARLAGRDPLPAWALVRMWGNCWRGLGSYSAARRLAERRRNAVYNRCAEAAGG
ncbi:MAG: glycosyl transferase family 2 [Deltaproteobacteria bacterium]|nr:glycosyl transferase family 2 [Deltaproteobacteria bacterium]MBP2678066.1 glycosyl transferase family 2 [Deltaproteobacteria bacterium]